VWKKGRSPTIFGLLKRLWIPLLVLVVVGAGGFTVSRLHGIFGAEDRPSYADTKASDSKPFDPKQMIYEVFGPAGTVANISYFDAQTEPQYVTNVSLPWRLQFDIGDQTAIGSLMAQGDSDSIGCRISVDDEVKAEKISDNVNAFTSCLLKNG
jgi:Mycobacterium membrane protein